MEVLKQKRELDQDTRSKVRFMTFIITMFARAYKMDKQSAYLYLEKYGGLDFLSKHWWSLHTDNPVWAVRDVYLICYKNGGVR
jgi:hypothetical protein